jgi:hypothetical protein
MRQRNDLSGLARCRPHFSFVAAGVVRRALLLGALIASKETWEFGSAPRAGGSCSWLR